MRLKEVVLVFFGLVIPFVTINMILNYRVWSRVPEAEKHPAEPVPSHEVLSGQSGERFKRLNREMMQKVENEAHKPHHHVNLLKKGTTVKTSCTPELFKASCRDGHCCREVKNKRIRARFTNRPFPQWDSFDDLSGDHIWQLPIQGSPLFKLVQHRTAQEKEIGTDDCHLQGDVTQISSSSVLFHIKCDQGILADISAELPSDEAHYLRLNLSLWSDAAAEAAWPKKGFGALEMYALRRNTGIQVTETRVTGPQVDDRQALDGLPLVIDGHFFVGVEHPLAVHEAGLDHTGPSKKAIGKLTHLDVLARPTKEDPWVFGAVVGAFSEPAQARRAFVTYLHETRPGRREPMVHYNSWYDFYSYQDEGFNGGFKDPYKDPVLIAKLRPDKLSEENCLTRVEAFGQELVTKRNTTLDSFLWDDGWDDPHTLWEFDKQRFPRRFDVIAEKSKQFGAGTGVWLSPWGGYGFPQENRIKYGKQFGYETNFNERIEVEAFSLAGPKYRKVFTETALKFRHEQGVNMFKFDGVAGDPREVAYEMEAMMGLMTDLRAATTPEGKKGKNDKDAIWINLTTGTWASPFFLLWADSIWRGGPDIPSRDRDWTPDFDRRFWITQSRPRTDVELEKVDGLTRRQRWIRWRSMVVYVLVVQKSLFFPISQLMIHGVVVGSHGDSLHFGLDKFDEVDFTQEIWSFVGLGLQLQELYVAPRYMTSWAWDILAEGLQWARREAVILRDSHWAFGDLNRERQVYCVASWSIEQKKGFIMLHNPTGIPQESQQFTLLQVLELPEVQKRLKLSVKQVKTAYRHKELAKFSESERIKGSSCGVLQPVLEGSVPEAQAGPCNIKATQKIAFDMYPSEVLVLEVRG